MVLLDRVVDATGTCIDSVVHARGVSPGPAAQRDDHDAHHRDLGIAIVATPGNVGSFELGGAAALALWKVPSETAFSVAIATHLIEVIPPLLLGSSWVVGGWSLVAQTTSH